MKHKSVQICFVVVTLAAVTGLLPACTTVVKEPATHTSTSTETTVRQPAATTESTTVRSY